MILEKLSDHGTDILVIKLKSRVNENGGRNPKRMSVFSPNAKEHSSKGVGFSSQERC